MPLDKVIERKIQPGSLSLSAFCTQMDLRSAVIARKASSMFWPVLAEVSTSAMWCASAYWNKNEKPSSRVFWEDGEKVIPFNPNWTNKVKYCINYLFGDLIFDDFSTTLIALISNQKFANIRGRVAFDFVEPHVDILEGLQAGDVIHHDDAVRAAVVRAGDGAEAVLRWMRMSRERERESNMKRLKSCEMSEQNKPGQQCPKLEAAARIQMKSK